MHIIPVPELIEINSGCSDNMMAKMFHKMLKKREL